MSPMQIQLPQNFPHLHPRPSYQSMVIAAPKRLYKDPGSVTVCGQNVLPCRADDGLVRLLMTARPRATQASIRPQETGESQDAYICLELDILFQIPSLKN